MSDLPITPTTQTFPPSLANSTDSPSAASASASLRKERGAIAAQRCDEQRPKCGTCQKFRLECNYREPQPTKKDKTLVEILDRIKSLEGKIDSLSHRQSVASSAAPFPVQPSSLPSPLPTTQQGVLGPSAPSASAYQFPEASIVPSSGDAHYQYVSSVHQMLKWPAIQQLFASVQSKLPNIDLSAPEREGPASMVALRRARIQNLPTDIPTPMPRDSGMGIVDPVTGHEAITISELNWETMQRLSKAYFDTINLLCPILNRQSFMSDTLPNLFNNGFSRDMQSTIAFLVFALGEVALEGIDGLRLHVYNGRASGVKGGSKDRPPGLELFNEARRRMGFNLTECSLENVQIFALARHDFFLRDPFRAVQPSSPGPGVSQITLHQLALQLEQWRGMLPAHLRWREDSPGAFPNSHAGELYNASLFTPATTPISPPYPTPNTPNPSNPNPSTRPQTPGPGLIPADPLMFTTDLDLPPPRYPYLLDIQVALLRSRYYYTKYLIHRPYLYKALHHPDAMSHDDAVGVAECLKACLKWPVAMSPTARHKRLVPCTFFFTQNFFGILVLLHLSRTVPILRRIRGGLCGERFELDAGETVGLYLDWVRDLREVDKGTEWHWEVVKGIYGLEE
ncbi:hypothetical protein NEMBOFW57_002094 [Staphylotrichum longicolle]|uniref:Zn(2)-C6 fungal-type domain-containing protein n=1 Tax=Staphylotrichum longicolle TaxID=669026 RepID=A0AAD4F2E0_9PEZI|nr:hypothetical protein NEMBOFW57_002094 [Staphylotrichum longicolle]